MKDDKTLSAKAERQATEVGGVSDGEFGVFEREAKGEIRRYLVTAAASSAIMHVITDRKSVV